MHRYIALTWPRHDMQKKQVARKISQQLLQSDDQATNWKVVAQGPGLFVLQTGAIPGRFQVYLLKKSMPEKADMEELLLDTNCIDNYCDGVILGKLFTKDYINNYQVGNPAPTDPIFDDIASHKIIDSNTRHLIDNYWGQYVALTYNKQTVSHHVLSDPTGGVPCFYTEHFGVTIYFSHITDCDPINDLHFSINWEHIRKRMIAYMIQTDDTGLENVYKLLPGECRTTTSQNPSKTFHWNPFIVAKQAINQPPIFTKKATLAATELRRVTMGCINAWASCYNHILLNLSGGLDSTIIAGCLAHANPKPKVTGINYFDSGNDERALARLAANFTNIKLLEYPSCKRTICQKDLEAMPRTPKLADYHYGLHFAPFEAKLAADIGADTVFNGQGGDELFYAPHNPFSAVDYARQKGVFRLGMLRVAMDIALICKISFKEVMHIVHWDRFKHSLNPLAQYDNSASSDTVHSDIRRKYRLRDTLHPLVTTNQTTTMQLPPGKMNHIAAVLAPYFEQGAVMPNDYLERALPLYSQPLVELCAQLPTYLLVAEGKSRGLARMAFINDIPSEIAGRESKGCGSSHHKAIFEENQKLSEAMLLGDNCLMVKKKLLDQDKLQQTMTGNLSDFKFQLPAIKPYLSIESWLQKWNKSLPKKQHN